ncbi:hypothetical protein VULLAG_LOCUS2644 [Vulpes lagopus]
MTKTDFL